MGVAPLSLHSTIGKPDAAYNLAATEASHKSTTSRPETVKPG